MFRGALRAAGVVTARRAVQPAAAALLRPAAPLPQRRWLRDCAEREQAEEKSVRDSMAVPAVPAGWSVEHTPGKGFFRMHKGDVMIDAEFEAHEGPTDETQERTSFTAYVTRNGITADFTLAYVPDGGLSLEGVCTYKSKAEACELSANADYNREQQYQGPDVNDLTETGLPEKMLDLLASEGVDDSLGEFVHKYIQVLEQDAYMAFLGDLVKLSS